MHKLYLEKMDFNTNKEKIIDIIDMLMCEVKETKHKLYEHIECEMYEMVYGKTLNDEMKMEWVQNMKPMAKWTYEEVESVVNSYGTDIPISSAYVIMNMFYSDMKSVFGNGDDEESLKRYIDATKCWYYDEDSNHTKEEKLFEYYFKVVK